MINTKPLIYIVMVNYNGYELTSEAILSLRKMSYSNYNIIIVDDCSTDNSMERLKKDFPYVYVTKSAKNSGLCKCYNIGIKIALKKGAEYVFLVQNDTKDFSKNYLEKIIEAFKKDKLIGMVGSKVYDYNGNLRWDGTIKNKMGVPINISEGFVIKREVFEKIGLMSEKLIVYFEDLDFIIRLRDAGYKTYFVPDVSFAHLGSGTFTKQKFKPNYLRIRNIILFLRVYCKDKSLFWKIKTFFMSLGPQINKIKMSFKHFYFISGVIVFLSIIIGSISGFFVTWESEIPLNQDKRV